MADEIGLAVAHYHEGFRAFESPLQFFQANPYDYVTNPPPMVLLEYVAVALDQPQWDLPRGPALVILHYSAPVSSGLPPPLRCMRLTPISEKNDYRISHAGPFEKLPEFRIGSLNARTGNPTALLFLGSSDRETWLTESVDDGKTWKPHRIIPLPEENYKAFLVKSPQGHLLLASIAYGAEPWRVQFRRSPDADQWSDVVGTVPIDKVWKAWACFDSIGRLWLAAVAVADQDPKRAREWGQKDKLAIFLSHSTDDGKTWANPEMLMGPAGDYEDVKIAAHGKNLFLAFTRHKVLKQVVNGQTVEFDRPEVWWATKPLEFPSAAAPAAPADGLAPAGTCDPMLWIGLAVAALLVVVIAYAWLRRHRPVDAGQ